MKLLYHFNTTKMWRAKQKEGKISFRFFHGAVNKFRRGQKLMRSRLEMEMQALAFYVCRTHIFMQQNFPLQCFLLCHVLANQIRRGCSTSFQLPFGRVADRIHQTASERCSLQATSRKRRYLNKTELPFIKGSMNTSRVAAICRDVSPTWESFRGNHQVGE